MPIRKRPRVEPTHDWQQLSLVVEGPEQRAYEVMRTCVLSGQSPAERARQTGVPARQPYRQVERFDHIGMLSLFALVKERAPADPVAAPAPAHRRPQGRVPRRPSARERRHLLHRQGPSAQPANDPERPGPRAAADARRPALPALPRDRRPGPVAPGIPSQCQGPIHS